MSNFSNLFEIRGSNLVRKVTTGARGVEGSVVGTQVKGYLRFELGGRTYAVHNVIWMIHNGQEIPDGYIVDHEDGDPLNNDPMNLRLATKPQNGYNAKLYVNNKSGFKGVSFDVQTGKWVAQIRFDGKNKKIGRFSTPELANEALVNIRAALHGAFANDG